MEYKILYSVQIIKKAFFDYAMPRFEVKTSEIPEKMFDGSRHYDLSVITLPCTTFPI